MTQQLDHEQGIAVGAVVHQAREFAGQAVPPELQRDVLLCVLPRQGREADLLANAARLEQQLELRKGVPRARQLRRPAGHENQDAPGSQSACQVRQEVDGRRVRPVQIVYEQHEGALGGKSLEQRRELARHALPGSVLRRRWLFRASELRLPARRNGLQGTRRLMIAAVIEQALERFPYRVIRLRTSDVLRASTAHDARRTSPPRVEEELLSQRSLARTG